MAISPNAQLAGTPGATKDLPSISNYLKDPKVQKYVMYVSLALNALLFLGLLGSLGSGGGRSSNPTVAPTALPTPTDAVLPRDTIGPTETPNEEVKRLNECFDNCTDEQFLNTLEVELEKVTDVKGAYIRNMNANNQCYGIYMQSTSPNKQFETSFRPADCDNYTQKPRQIVIGNKAYIYSSNTDTWDSATVSELVRTRLIDTKDLVAEQQNITSEYEEINGKKIRTLTGTSRIVNDFNQVVNKEVVIKVNQEYEVIYYSDSESGLYTEEGSYFDYFIPNNISQP